MKCAGKPDAGKPHVGFDEAGAGNVIRLKYCGTVGKLGGNGENKPQPKEARQPSTLPLSRGALPENGFDKPFFLFYPL